MATELPTQKQQEDFTSSKAASETTGHHLITLNKILIDLLNNRQYDTLTSSSILDPDVHIELHGTRLTGAQGFVDGYKDVADLSPGLHVRITNSSAIVDERLDKATVLFHVMISAFADQMTRAGTILSCWRKHEDGRWTCYSYYMFYGIQEFH